VKIRNKSPLATFQNSNIHVPKKIANCGSVLKYNILHYKMVFAARLGFQEARF
jgi:hypothetical protein